MKSISNITGIEMRKLEQYTLFNDVLNVLRRPNSVQPTEEQYEKIEILNQFLINYEITREYPEREINFSDSRDAGRYFLRLLGNKKDKEVMMGAFLDKDGRLVEIKRISEGSLSMAPLYSRDLVKYTLDNEIKSVILCHNHPSGNANPSKEDIDMTRKMINILEPLNIDIIDHLIVGEHLYSMRDGGQINFGEEPSLIGTFNRDSYSRGHEYYDEHFNELMNSFAVLTGIDRKKLKEHTNNLDKADKNPYDYSDKIFKLVTNADTAKDVLGLGNEEYNKLIELNNFTKYYYEISILHKFRDRDKVSSPNEMADVFQSRGHNMWQRNEIYLMLYNTKLELIGTEKLTKNINREKIVMPMDILTNTLNYDAHAVSLVHLNPKVAKYQSYIWEDFCQKTFNILDPINIKLIDYIFINTNSQERETTSLKVNGLLPDRPTRRADYSKITIESRNEKIVELEEEWELEI